ncbi:MAG: FAD-dependent monooxygenase [Nitratireductor sp.]|nr:FAD-dependent monooxygenase [Nitratireductor sp.]
MNEFDVIINGGGPVGMGLAIELGQRGIRTCVVERHGVPQKIPKGQNLTQRTGEHMRAWGCAEGMAAAHPLPPDAGIGGQTLYKTLLSDHAHEWFNRGSVGAYYWGRNQRIPQYKTETVLRARAATIAEVTIEYGWSGEALEQDGDGVELTIGDGQNRRKLRGRYLVGADGARSAVREAAGITQTRTEHDRLMALLVFNSTELHELLQRYPGKAIYKVLHPDLEGYWLFFGRVDHGTSWFFHAPVPPGTTKENFDFKAMLHRAVGQPFNLEFEHIGLWELRVAIADHYRAGRVFIAGDAAHSHPPYGGYGVNTGFEDARNLGWKLAAVLAGWGGEGLLDSYEAERRPVFASTAKDFIERYIEKDRQMLAEFSPEKDMKAFLAAWGERAKDTWDVEAFEPNYEGSPIVDPVEGATPSAIGSHLHDARAGHHLSPQNLADGTPVFEALGPDFTLLAADPRSASVFEAAARKLGLPLKTVAELGEEAIAAYGSQTILVRPDGFVAWTGDSVGDAGAILSRAIGGVTPTPAG